MHVEGSWGSGSGDVTVLAFATVDGNAAQVVVESVSPEDDAAIVSWFGDPGQPKVLHDAKGPMLALAARGWPLLGLDRDTALSAYLARPDQRSYDLADLTVRYLKRELKSGTSDDGQLSLDGIDDESSSETAMLHASAVLDLAAALDDELAERGGTGLLADIELPLIDVLAGMEQVGIAVDHELLEELEEGFAVRVRDAAEAAYAVIGKEINLGSPKQLQVVLFEERGMPKTKRTKTGYTTDADALQGSVREDPGPVPRAPARAPRRHPPAPDRPGTAQDRGGRRPHPHHVQPADRRDRPALQHRPQPAEHPGPHRGRPPHPRGLRRRSRAMPS